MPATTHREVKVPTVSARFLADYMAASETGKRSIIMGCKYQTAARIMQHDEARMAVGKFIRSGAADTRTLLAKADELRKRLADTDFDRSNLDTNADFIARFAAVSGDFALPAAEISAPGYVAAFTLSGVKINPQLVLRLRRVTRTNKVLVGAGALRYAKGAPLKEDVALWQSAFLAGWLKETTPEDEGTSDIKLCVTIDAYSGRAFTAPTDSVSRYKNMASACISITERWPNIKPPKGAVLSS